MITYTFPSDDKTPAHIRGVTVSGGQIDTRLVDRKVVDVVCFETKINGQQVVAGIKGRPELEAALAEHQAAKAAQKLQARQTLEAAVPGLAAYEAASTANANAAEAYDRASEHGYPAKQAAAAKAASEALEAVLAQYPATKAWRTIIGYTQASNYSKSAAGDAARKAVMDGTPIMQALEAMTANWSAAASRAVDNS